MSGEIKESLQVLVSTSVPLNDYQREILPGFSVTRDRGTGTEGLIFSQFTRLMRELGFCQCHSIGGFGV